MKKKTGETTLPRERPAFAPKSPVFSNAATLPSSHSVGGRSGRTARDRALRAAIGNSVTNFLLLVGLI